MNTFFIKIFFSLICFYLFLYIISFSIFEIKNNKNVLGGVFTLVLSITAILYSNIVFWIN